LQMGNGPRFPSVTGTPQLTSSIAGVSVMNRLAASLPPVFAPSEV
jgi:hypothetical protein